MTTRFSPSRLIFSQRAEYILNWKEVAGATSYKVRVQPLTPILHTEHPDGNCTLPSSVTVHGTRYTHEFTATLANRFYYTFQACNSAGCSCPRGFSPKGRRQEIEARSSDRRKGCLDIGSGFLSCSPGSLSERGTLTAPSGNRYPLDFVARKIEDSSSWRISRLSIALEE